MFSYFFVIFEIITFYLRENDIEWNFTSNTSTWLKDSHGWYRVFANNLLTIDLDLSEESSPIRFSIIIPITINPMFLIN